MLRARVLPALNLLNNQLVKTTRFTDPRYVGDPVNIINIFSSFEVDEIALLDIRAGIQGRPPPLNVLRLVASECTIPLSYGGGIRTLDDARSVMELGFEKVIVGTAAFERPHVISEIVDVYGVQAVIVAVDAVAVEQGWEVRVRSGTHPIGRSAAEHAERCEELGAGEILVTSVDRDGTWSGYDLGLVASVTDSVSVPVIALGGAGRRADLAEPVLAAAASGSAAGSIFVFQGRGRGVLVNFPSRAALQSMFEPPRENS